MHLQSRRVLLEIDLIAVNPRAGSDHSTGTKSADVQMQDRGPSAADGQYAGGGGYG